jgi:hypothetical protein
MLTVYSSPNPDADYSSDASYSNPLAFSVDGQTGAVITRKLYLRNDDGAMYYTGITLTPVVDSGLDIVSGATEGFTWKLIAGDTEPTEIQWASVDPAAPISLADIGSSGNGDTVTYLPFWLRIELPRGVDVQVFQGANLEISADENLA